MTIARTCVDARMCFGSHRVIMAPRGRTLGLCGVAIGIVVACGGSSPDAADGTDTGDPRARAPQSAGAQGALAGVSSGGAAGEGDGSAAGRSVDSDGGEPTFGGNSGAAGRADISAPCRDAGAECSETASCCEGSTCIVTPESSTLCAANCIAGSECQSGCCAPLRNGIVSVCSPPDYCATPPRAPTTPVGCGSLILLAADGEFLGIGTGNQFAVDGVCNEFSSYGSEFSSTSIFNQFSTYGSEFSSSSAYSPYASTPPVLFCSESGDAVAYVTKNQALTPHIDPDVLCVVLEQSGI